MPLVIALPKSSRPSAAAMPSPRPSQVSSAASSRRSVSRRSVRSRTSQSTRTTATRSTAPSSASVSPARSKTETRQNTNITIRHHGHKGIGITVDERTGAFADFSDESEEDSSGLKFHSSQDDDDFTSDEEDDDEEDDEWDYIEDDIQPSDSASRPHHARSQQSHRHAVPPVPPAPSVPVTQRPRQSRRASRHPVAAPDPHSAHHSRSRSSGPELARDHQPRRHQRRSTHQQADSLEEDIGDDYPYPGPPQPPGVAPGHPSQQWSHIPPANGYAPSTMSHHAYYPPGGAASPTGQLVANGYHSYDHYGHGNGFNPQQPNPFSPGPIGGERDGYFGQGHGQHQGPRAGNPNRRSMGGPPSDAMMSYGQMSGHPGFQGYPPFPYGGMPGMSQMPYPGHYSQHPSPPPPEERHHSRSKRGTPRPRSVHHEFSDEDHHHQVVPAPRHAPAPAPPPPPPPPAAMPMVQVIPAPQPLPPPPDTAKEDAMLKKLNDLLSGKAEEDAKKEAAERKAAELAKFDRLESLLIAQQEAQIAKEKRKQKDAEDAAAAAAEAKKKGDEDKLANLEKLILAQKDEQLKREAAAEAARKAAADAADAEAKKVAEEKKAAAEAAALLLEAAKKAREEAEKKAAAEAEETKKAHEKALAEAKAAAEELEKAKKAAEEEAAKLKPSDAPKAPIKFKDAVGRKFSFPWHLCKTWKGMEELIKQAFLHVDIIGPHVHQGHYDLVGPDGEIILPQVWETMVQPDWAITMHMWPMPEPPKEPPKEEIPIPPPLDHQQFMAQQAHSASRAKAKKGTGSKHKISRGVPGEAVVVPVSGGTPIPPPVGVTPGVSIMPTPSASHKPKSKTKPNGFFAWAAGGTGRSGSVKKNSKTK